MAVAQMMTTLVVLGNSIGDHILDFCGNEIMLPLRLSHCGTGHCQVILDQI